MVVSAFSLVETVLFSNETLGIGETEVLSHENGAVCDKDGLRKLHAVVERGSESGFKS